MNLCTYTYIEVSSYAFISMYTHIEIQCIFVKRELNISHLYINIYIYILPNYHWSQFVIGSAITGSNSFNWVVCFVTQIGLGGKTPEPRRNLEGVYSFIRMVTTDFLSVVHPQGGSGKSPN